MSQTHPEDKTPTKRQKIDESKSLSPKEQNEDTINTKKTVDSAESSEDDQQFDPDNGSSDSSSSADLESSQENLVEEESFDVEAYKKWREKE
jgi:hypothetical protein